MTAWSNWFQWVIVGMSEIIAVGSYMKYWFPDLPAWIPGIIAIILGTANLISVKSFGEFEFWFAMIKIVTIILMIVVESGLFSSVSVTEGMRSDYLIYGRTAVSSQMVFRIFLCFVFGCCGISRGRADRDYGRGSEGPAKRCEARFRVLFGGF